MNFGKIINCHNYCNLIDNRVHIFSNIGGISGWNDAGSIEGCSNHGTISSDWQAGGISGFNEGGVISKCINHGNIRNHTYSRPSGDGAAGISYSFNGTIEDCTNYGTIEGEGAYLSGIGDCSQKSIISNCHNMGEVKGFTSIGGISASIPDGTVKNCINEGNITLTENPYGYSGDIGGISAQTGNDTEEEGNGYIINCTNKGRINGSTLFIGNITGKLERTGSISGCTYGGYVNGMPGTEMNAVGKEL